MRNLGVWVAQAAILGLAVGACQTTSVVQTARMETLTAEGLGKGRVYAAYFLPQTAFVLTAKKAGGGDDKESAASAIATVTNTITIDGKTVEVSKPKARTETAEDPDCKKVPADYAKLAKAHGRYILDRETDVSRLVALAAELHPDAPLPTAEQITAASGFLTAARQRKRDDDERVDAALRLDALLRTECPQKIALDVAIEVTADTTAGYAVVLRDAGFSSDDVSLKIDSRGMLSSISTTADEKSGEVAVGTLTSIGTVIGAVNPMTGVPGAASAMAGFVPAPGVSTGMGIAGQRRMAATRLHGEMLKFAADLAAAKLAALPEQPSAPAYPVRYTLNDLITEANVTTPKPIGASGKWLHVRCTPLSAGMTRVEKARTMAKRTGLLLTEGVLVSAPRACVAAIGDSGATPGEQTFNVAALDSRYPMEAFLLRTQLIKRGSTYAFKDGQLTEVTSSKPSTALAAVALPGTLIGGLFSGIVTGVQGQGGVYKEQAALLEAKASIYKGQAALIEAQAAAKKAAEPEAAPKAPEPVT